MAELPYRALTEPIAERAQCAADWPGLVIVHEDGRHEVVTAERLFAEMKSRSGAMRDAGIKQDDVVVLALGHGLDLVASFLGSLHAGIVPAIVPAYVAGKQDTASLAARLRLQLRACGARAVVAAPSDAKSLGTLLDDLGVIVLDAGALASTSMAEESRPASRFEPGRIAFLQLSSGTGGAPKGIAHTHERVLRYIGIKRYTTPMSSSDVVVSWLPLYHDLGLVSGLLAPQVLGARSVLISPLHWVRDPKVLFRTMQEHGGTLSFVPNFALNHSIRAIRERDLEGVDMSTWNGLVVGAEPVRWQSLESFAQRFARNGFYSALFHCGYGMAECIEAATATPRGRPPSVDWIDQSMLQTLQRAVSAAAGDSGAVPMVSCGVPMPGMELKVVGADGGSLPERAIGEIVLHSDYIFEGYHLRPDLDELALRDGWFFTGDLGYLADGELYVTGRRKDLIIVGGRNVYPDDVEAAAEAVEGVHPGRSVAFGVADDVAGTERVVLVCEIPEDTSTEHKTVLERGLRREVVRQVDVALGQVHFAPRGWIIKTSSGKKARPANREKYFREIVARKS